MKKSKLFALVLAVVLTLSSLVPSFANNGGYVGGMSPEEIEETWYLDLGGPGSSNPSALFENVYVGKYLTYSLVTTVYVEAIGYNYLVVRRTVEEAVNHYDGQRLILSIGDDRFGDDVKNYLWAGTELMVNLEGISSSFKTKANPNGVIVSAFDVLREQEPLSITHIAPYDEKRIHEPIYTFNQTKDPKSPTGQVTGRRTFKITKDTFWGYDPKAVSTINMPSMMTTGEILHYYSWTQHVPFLIDKAKVLKGDDRWKYPNVSHNTYFSKSNKQPIVYDNLWLAAWTGPKSKDHITNYNKVEYAQGRFLWMIADFDKETKTNRGVVVAVQIPGYHAWGEHNPWPITIASNPSHTIAFLHLSRDAAKRFPVNLKYGQEIVFEYKAEKAFKPHGRMEENAGYTFAAIDVVGENVYDAKFFYDSVKHMCSKGKF